jgi:RNA polymerase sigma factor (sigma-70 family)
MRMFDREIVDSIVDGDPAGLAAAYDQYARGLYAYCRSLLGEPADAADAVQDTFIIAAAKVSGLRDPERLRSWLYAVARNECHGRLRASALATPLDEAAEMTDDVADLGDDVEQAELRDLVWAALGGLNPGEREVIELNLRHEFDGADLADVLGVPRNQAHALASRARSQFETSLGVLLVARTGQEYCPDLAEILDGWDGELTPLIRKRVNRHIDRCDVCGERRRDELSPAMLLGLLPVAMLPTGLRADVMHLVSDDSPDAESYRDEVADRSEPFDRIGFPRQFMSPSIPRSQRSYVLAAAAGIACLVVLGGAMYMLLGSGGQPASGASATLPAPVPSAGTPIATPEAAVPTPSSTVKPSSPAANMTAPVPTGAAPLLPTPSPKVTVKTTPKASTPPSTLPDTPPSTLPDTPPSTLPDTPPSTLPQTPATDPNSTEASTPAAPASTGTAASSASPSIVTSLLNIIGEL